MSEASSQDCIAWKLPQPNALSGRILQHSINVIEGLFSKHDPMIWKVGFTHSPKWRWGNPIYGYANAPERWSNMVVLFASPEACTPAMLEATLIEKFKCT